MTTNSQAHICTKSLHYFGIVTAIRAYPKPTATKRQISKKLPRLDLKAYFQKQANLDTFYG
jgi:hypothetical protein